MGEPQGAGRHQRSTVPLNGLDLLLDPADAAYEHRVCIRDDRL